MNKHRIITSLDSWHRRIISLSKLIDDDVFPACTYKILLSAGNELPELIKRDKGLLAFYSCCDGGDMSRFNVYQAESVYLDQSVLVFGKDSAGQDVGIELSTGEVVSRYNQICDWIIICSDSVTMFSELFSGEGYFSTDMWREAIDMASINEKND